jgi:hypothetical protein
MSPRFTVPACLIALLALSACNPAPPPTPTRDPSYPPVAATAAAPTGYPAPAASPTACADSATPFEFDRPLAVGATTISGSGVPNVPIVIANITFMGEQIGSGTIGPDGRFSIEVLPLTSGSNIGLRLGDLSGTPFDEKALTENLCLHGPEPALVPQVGFFLDSTPVR